MIRISRTIQKLDAADQAPGRLATRIAMMLMGKDKPSFVNNVDAGAIVEVVHASKMRITGSKMDTKEYHSHTMHPGGFASRKMKQVFENDPADVLRRAVDRMLPKNSFRPERLKRLLIKN